MITNSITGIKTLLFGIYTIYPGVVVFPFITDTAKLRIPESVPEANNNHRYQVDTSVQDFTIYMGIMR